MEHIAAIETAPVVAALQAYRDDHTSGLSPDQSTLVKHFVHRIAGQTHVDPIAVVALFNAASRDHVNATSVGDGTLNGVMRSATFARVVNACFPPDFAAAVMEIASPPAKAPPVDVTQVRIAEALELIALQAVTGAKTNSTEVVGAMMELRERIAARHR